VVVRPGNPAATIGEDKPIAAIRPIIFSLQSQSLPKQCNAQD
jgi:hypothetical protein